MKIKRQMDEKLLSYASRRPYFNPRYIARQFKPIRSFRDFWDQAHTAADLFRMNVIERLFMQKCKNKMRTI